MAGAEGWGVKSHPGDLYTQRWWKRLETWNQIQQAAWTSQLTLPSKYSRFHTLRGNEKGTRGSVGKTSLCQVQDPEEGDETRSLLVRKVAKTRDLGSAVSSVMADGQDWRAQAIVQVGMDWSGSPGGLGHPPVGDSKPELDAAVSLRSPNSHVLALDLSK